MKTLLLTVALTLFVVHTVATQSSELNIKYNRIEDRTNVSTKSQGVKGAGLNILFYFNHKGKALEDPINQVGMVLDSYSRNWKYLRTTELRLFVLADGERFSVDGRRHDSNVYSGSHSVSVSERLIFPLSMEQLKTISTAKSVEFQLSRDQFTLSERTVRGIRELLAYVGT